MNQLTEPIIVEQSFNASLKSVWEAITQLDKMKQWYFSNIPSFQAHVGFKTQFVVEVEDRVFPHHWEIVEVIDSKKIAYEWQFDGYPGKGVSTFQLKQVGNLCHLTFSFITLENFPDNIPEFKRESGVQGWNYFITESLANYLKQ